MGYFIRVSPVVGSVVGVQLMTAIAPFTKNPYNLTLLILDFGFWILDFLGYKPQRHLLYAGEPVHRSGSPWWVEKSQIVNIKSPSPAPLWSGSIQNRKSKIQNWLASLGF